MNIQNRESIAAYPASVDGAYRDPGEVLVPDALKRTLEVLAMDAELDLGDTKRGEDASSQYSFQSAR